GALDVVDGLRRLLADHVEEALEALAPRLGHLVVLDVAGRDEPVDRARIHRVQDLLKHPQDEVEVGLLLGGAAHAASSFGSSAAGSDWPRIRSAAFSPTMIEGIMVLPPGT